DEDDDAPPAVTVRVCESITCSMFGAEKLADELRDACPDVRIQKVPCVGRCAAAPVAVVGANPVERATVDSVTQAVRTGAVTAGVPPYVDYARWRDDGGYALVQACHNGARSVDSVIATLKDAGLRGLGGAGFPAGSKWEILRKQPKPRYLAVNIDEGEPGTFKDRHYLEREPHRFLEGALIAAWAIEAEGVYIYLRDEYAGCRRVLEQELAALRADPPCPLPPIELRRGAGAYIRGAESAMIESIDGKRGMPRLRPPYVAQVGLFGRPTLEHNMETLHWVPLILEKGADWFTR